VGSDILSSGTLTVNGGTFTTTDAISVGFDGGAGTFLMTGGTVTSGTSFVGSGGGSVGTAERSSPPARRRGADARAFGRLAVLQEKPAEP
jgi:hypothetical protein